MTAKNSTQGETKILDPSTVPARRGSISPSPHDEAVGGREKRAPGYALGPRNFGVNLARLSPGAWSSQRHRHARQDEFIYVVECEL